LGKVWDGEIRSTPLTVSKLGTDVYNGTVKTYYADGEGGLVIKSETDITPFIEQNKAQYNAIDNKAKWKDLTKIASIPYAVISMLNEKGIMRGFHITDQKALKAWLNDPENVHFRTRPGRV
jgi:hypothetical protein